jgi:Serine/Threonine/Tyrosine Kinase found in polyvalent proteins
VDDLKIIKHELQRIISGESNEGKRDFIKTTQAYLRGRKEASGKAKNTEFSRTEEERALIEFGLAHNLIITKEDFGTYITEGAEQKIYFNDGDSFVIKVADAIFYSYWVDYFNNLLLHNYFFPDTAYTLVGFLQKQDKFYCVVQQQFVLNSEPTNIDKVKGYLLENGFAHKKNNDYFHPELGLIIEDLHDENVLTNNGVLFFIDTVFYITDNFYK